jgi:all-trans-retinol 13,14-reductase
MLNEQLPVGNADAINLSTVTVTIGGVHYIGDLHEGGHLRNIYEGPGVSQDIIFCELNPDDYDHIIVGDKCVDFPKDKENLIERLKSRFPHNAKRIDSYFADLTTMMNSLSNIGPLAKVI